MDCFVWDELVIKDLNQKSIKKYINIRYKVINENKYLRLANNGNTEYDGENWSYIFFYYNNQLLNDAIAVASGDLNFNFWAEKNKRITRARAILNTEIDYFSNFDKSDSTMIYKVTPDGARMIR